MKHQLAVEFQSGVFVASCSCGRWTTSLMPHVSERPSDTYNRIEEAHRLHVEQVAPEPPTPGCRSTGDGVHRGD
jgi:hypothetical protein